MTDLNNLNLFEKINNGFTFCLTFRTKQNLDLNDELSRSKRLLDEKYFEAGRLRDEAVNKGDQNADARAQLQDVEREIESVKV